MVTLRCNRIVVLFIGLLLGAVAYSQPILTGVTASGMPSSTLLFKSGFEDDVVYVPWSTPVGPTLSAYEDIEGSDEPGHTWPINLRSPTLSRIHHFINAGVDPVDDLSDYFDTHIETVTGHLGGSTKVLYQELTKEADNTTQSWYEFEYASPTAATDADTYIKYWMKLPSDAVTDLGSDGWRTVLQIKAVDTDYRLEAYLYTDQHGTGYWYMKGDEWVVDEYIKDWDVHTLVDGASTVEVPLDEWFTMEYFWHRTDDENGRFFWAVNGDTVCDRYGSLYGDSNEYFHGMWLFGLYMSVEGEDSQYQWIDDVEIWTGFPNE